MAGKRIRSKGQNSKKTKKNDRLRERKKLRRRKREKKIERRFLSELGNYKGRRIIGNKTRELKK